MSKVSRLKLASEIAQLCSCFIYAVVICNHSSPRGAWWLSGRVSDSGVRSGVQNLSLPCCVLEQDTLLPSLLPESTGNTQEAVAPSQHD